MKLKDYLYYSEDKVKLYNADCIDIMKKLPDNYKRYCNIAKARVKGWSK